MGIYEVERIVAKRFVRGKAEYFIPWKNYCPSENTWEPAEHLPEELITAFCADECKERLALLFEKGLKSPLACNESITMKHVVLRSTFPEKVTLKNKNPCSTITSLVSKGILGDFPATILCLTMLNSKKKV